ncbi:2-oxoglutarate dehydrogenase, mitochondrial-like [Dorcoceras hygrometricum]|uniref:2-oxoglutarate dehydrogenase, mitochondrial-like n=1 Tax=Dorcoceras hygrometricum TaxID=472368 RepID=A0A2Z7BMN3_9LAMI|nr:2-oxoglutarate dehydrogenase, mitochondrial-like [Dorcoceras hygrometricum]
MKSRKQVSLVGTRSPIKRSWTRIISAIHDPKKVFPIATGATSMYSPHVQPKNLKFQNRSKPGPISHTDPKTSWAARDRPEPNPRRIQTRRYDIAGAEAGRRPPPPTKTRAALICANVRHHMARIGRPATSHLPQTCAYRRTRRRATISRGAAHIGATIRPASAQRRSTNHATVCTRLPGLRRDQARDASAMMRDRRASSGRHSRDKRASSARDGARRGAAACGGVGRSMCDDISAVLI